MYSLIQTARSLSRRYAAFNAHLRQFSANAAPETASPPTSAASAATPLWAGSDVEVAVHKSLHEMIPQEIVNISGRIFNAPVRPDIVHSVVVWQLARRRAGTAKTKTRGEVRGSGRKIRPQKGTGRSRQGAITSPIFVGGGRAHGPVPRSYDYALPLNIRVNGLRSLLSSKYANGQLWVVASIDLPDATPDAFADVMDRNGWRSALFVDANEDGEEGVTASLRQALVGANKSSALRAADLNVYDGMRHDHIVLSTAAVSHLDDQFKQYKFLY